MRGSKLIERPVLRTEQSATAAVLVCLCAAPTLAQPAAAATTKTAPRPTLPPVGGPGSISGVWVNSEFTDFRVGPPCADVTGPGCGRSDAAEQRAPIPYLPAVRERIEQQRQPIGGAPRASAGSHCLPNGMGGLNTPKEQAIQILETPNQVTVLFEYYNVYRTIYLGEEHPPNLIPSNFGDSVGHWEGDTLVVDTIGLKSRTDSQQTEKEHVVERIRRTGANTLEDVMTIEDSTVYSRPWTRTSSFRQVRGLNFIGEYVCDNQRNGVGVNGETDVRLQR